MIPGGQKSKGNLWETKVMRQLRTIYPDAHRSIGSGCSYVPQDTGDVIAGQWMVECKHHAAVSKGEIDKYWQKIVGEADKAELMPLLVWKENRKPPLCMFYNPDCGDLWRTIMYWEEFLEMLSKEEEYRTVLKDDCEETAHP